MDDVDNDPVVQSRRGAARYLELLLFLGMGVVFLPAYALVTGVAWFITGRELFSTAQWPLVLAIYWIAEVLITVNLLWRYRKTGRKEPDAFAVGQILGSTLAWAVATGFDARAIAVGFVVGIVYAVLHGIYTRLTDNLSEEEGRDKVRSTMTDIAESVTEDRRKSD